MKKVFEMSCMAYY